MNASRPLVLAAWRCKLLRDAAAMMVGLGLVIAGMQGTKVMQGWLSTHVPCPWQRSGELCTVLPYLLNQKRSSDLPYERCWLEAEDGERFAFDWVFPPTGFDPQRPVLVLLTGLAPNQHWTAAAGFIADAAWHFTHRANMTVVVLVARGTMDTQVNKNLFHGARVTDLRQMLEFTQHPSLDFSIAGIKPKIFAAGYSMGAIILANYCGHYDKDPLIAGGIHFSGLHDAAFNMNFKYSEETWQAYLAYNLKWTIAVSAQEEASKRGVDMNRIMSGKVASVVDIDKDFVSVYNGYDGVLDYYRDLSLASDDKWRNVSIPLLAVAARDDPITHCDALRAKEFSADNHNLLFLITDRGGHVGWPRGVRPWKHGWDFINEVHAAPTLKNPYSRTYQWSNCGCGLLVSGHPGLHSKHRWLSSTSLYSRILHTSLCRISTFSKTWNHGLQVFCSCNGTLCLHFVPLQETLLAIQKDSP
ncbi:unnamed protein product [Durusdinium trenchii]|uniref:Serine aminopeptidase S33 domain-containing protein n=1 Tax=Durusdinium trenchii TaxID=1381693 RepID=A0ABP0MQF6_9DINO